MTIDRGKVSSLFGLLNNSAQDYSESSFKQIRCLRYIMKAMRKPISINICHTIVPSVREKSHKFRLSNPSRIAHSLDVFSRFSLNLRSASFPICSLDINATHFWVEKNQRPEMFQKSYAHADVQKNA